MALRLYNTLSGKIEEFQPLEDNEVRMYACGPTVYDYGHIGNFRTFVAVDLLRRFLRQSGYDVRHVMNITDVDDKIIRNAARDGVSVKQYTAKYEKAFLEDCGYAEHRAARCWCAPPSTFRRWRSSSRKLVEKGLRLSRRRWLVLLPHREISRSTASSPKKISRAWRMARAWMSTNTKKTARAISLLEGAQAGRSFVGDVRSGRGVRAGTSSAP